MVDSRVEGVMVVSEVVVPLRMRDPGVDLGTRTTRRSCGEEDRLMRCGLMTKRRIERKRREDALSRWGWIVRIVRRAIAGDE